MKINSKRLPFTKKFCLVMLFFCCMFVFASFTREDRQKVRAFKKDLMSKLTDKKEAGSPAGSSAKKTSSASSLAGNDKGHSSPDILKNNPFSPAVADTELPETDPEISAGGISYPSKEKEGTIGTFSDQEEDRISDNFFTIDVPLVENTMAYLEYDLFGLASHQSVPRSINNNVAIGGNIVVPNAKWSHQREVISSGSIKKGLNTVLFTSPSDGVKYKVKNLKIVFDKDKPSYNAMAVSSILSGNELYIKGNNITGSGATVNNEYITVRNGEFEKIIHLSETDKSKGSFLVTAGGISQSYKLPAETNSFKTLNNNYFNAKGISVSKDQEFSVDYEGINIKIDKETSASAYLEVLKLRAKDFPATSQGIKNVTADNAAYRISVKSGKLDKKIKITIPYDEKRLGAFSVRDIKAFYFDYTSKQWKIEKSAVLDEQNKTLIIESSSDHDYINGVISTPESPQTNSLTSTSLNGLKAGNPTAQVHFIKPPTASQDGDAKTSYPIIVPEGRKGMQPNLSISYTSAGGNGWMGEGWDISGLSAITVDVRWGSPIFDSDKETELYSLDGEMLVYPNNYLPHRHNNVDETSDVFDTNKQLRTAHLINNKKTFYLRKNHDFTKIERYGTTPSQYTWIVTGADGTKNYYGGSDKQLVPSAVVRNTKGDIVKWGLIRTEDVFGNYVEYIYDNTIISNQGGENANLNNGQYFHISKIIYTKRNGKTAPGAKYYSVEFERETIITRQDISMNAKLGVNMVEPYKLKNIYVKYDDQPVRTYVLNYTQGEFYKTLLSTIQEFDRDYQPGNMATLTNQYNLEYYNDIVDEKERSKSLFGPDTDVAGTGSYSDAFPLLPNFLMPSKIGATNTFEWGVNGRLPGVGLNFLFPSNNAYGHIMAAFSIGMSQAEAKKAQELMDFNGDGISDIIYRKPGNGLFFKPGILSPTGALTWGQEKTVNYLNSNFSLTKTKSDHLGYDAGINVFGIGFNFSQMWSTSKSETSAFIIDANSDGLMDVVKDGEVLFSKVNGSGNVDMSKYSDNTENMVVVADTVGPHEPPLDGWSTISKNDVVKVWIAPKSGNIQITDRVKMEDVPNAKAVYSIEVKNPLNPQKNGRLYIKEIVAGPSENISIAYYNTYYSQIQALAPANQDHLAINSPNRVYVEAGDKVYIRLHKNENYSFKVLSNPEITYVSGKYSSNTEEYEQDGFYVNNGSYATNFFLNNHTKPIQVNQPGVLHINVPQIVFPKTTDDIRYKVVKVNLNNNTETALYTSPVYPQNDFGVTIAGTSISNVSIPQSEVPSIVKVVVESDSHTAFKNSNWNYTTASFTPTGGPSTFYNVVADYPSNYITEFNQKYNLAMLAFTTPIPVGVHNYKIEINKVLTSTTGLTNGSFYYIIKKAGHVLGKRRVIISGNGTTVSEVDMLTNQVVSGVSPITFYTGDASNMFIPVNERINIQVYCRTQADMDVYKAYSNIFQGNAFNIYYMQGNSYLGATSHTSINTANLENLGQFYNNWSQFLYNEYADVVPVSTPDGFGLNPDTPSDNYGRLINPGKIQPATVPVNVSYPACDNLPTPEATAQCIAQQINNSGYYQSPANFTPTPIKPMEVYLTRSGRDQNGVITEIYKWIGVGPEQYAMAESFKDDETVSGFFDPFVANPDLPDNLILQGNVDTKMYGINKKYYSKSRTNTLSGSLFGAGLQNANSNLVGNGSICLQDYMDMNGDGYPDIVYPDAMQITNSTGGLKGLQFPPNIYTNAYITNSNSDVNTLSAQFSPNTFASAGVNQRHGEVLSMGNNFAVNILAGSDNSSPWSASVGANYNSKDSGESYWLDLNGDGLLDRITGGGSPSIRYYMNYGYHLGSNSQNFKNLETYASRPVGSGGIGFSFNLGSIANVGFSGGAGATASFGTSDATFEDINGDGLTDILNIGSNATYVKYNLGNKFSDPVEIFKLQNSAQNKIDYNNEAKTYNASLSVGASYFYNFPIVWWPFPPIPLIYMKIGGGATANVGISIAEVDKTFKDMNGDGLPDLVISKNDGFVVNHSRIGRTNKLKTVSNGLTKGRFTINYAYSKPSYDNPYAKLVLTEVSINNPDVNTIDYSYPFSDPTRNYITRFEYEEGKYDRREREFFGFAKVYIKDMEGPNAVYRTVKNTYYNNSYFLRGLLTKIETFAGNTTGVLLSKTENEYNLHKLINSNTQLDINTLLPLTFDTGGKEGRKMAVALLVKTKKTNYAAGSGIETRSDYTYNVRGQMIRYGYFSNNANNNYSTNITYSSDAALLTKNILNVPELVRVYNSGSALIREKNSISDAFGNVAQIRMKLNDNETAITDYTYNMYGNVTSVTYPSNNNSQRYSLSYAYDSELNKYITQTTNIFGLASYSTYDPKFDAVTQTTDVAGNSMVYEYDAKGRIISVLAPKDADMGYPYSISYKYFMSPYATQSGGNYTVQLYGVHAMHTDDSNQGNDIETVTLADFLGRVVQVKKDIDIAGEEKMSVSGMVIYDLHGRPVKKYHPTVEAKNPAVNNIIKLSLSNYFKTIEYDALDRTVKLTDEDGMVTQSAYNQAGGLYKTTVLQMQNANAQLKSEVFSNAEGRATITKQYLTNETLTSTYDYDIAGNVLTTTDPDGISTMYTYDLAGRKVVEEHADRGITRYEYDNYGNLSQYVSANLKANGQAIKYIYDHNRLIEIKLPQLSDGSDNPNNVIYKYGDAGIGNNSGRLIGKYDGTGATEYEHGNMGEVIVENRKIIGYNIPITNTITKYYYDSWGRIKNIGYPDGENITYTYDLGGNLSTIYNNNNYYYVNGIFYDGYEQKTFIKYGNGATENYSYQPTNRRLDNHLLKDVNSSTLLNNNYTYDFIGNITHLNNTAGLSPNGMGNAYDYTYEYDKLNRLVYSTGNFAQPGSTPPSPYAVSNSTYSLDMRYTGSGKILQKISHHEQDSNVIPQNTYDGFYSYPPENHRLQTVFDANTGSTEAFEYDENGNIAAHSDQNGLKRLFWDELDRMKAISDPNNGIFQYYVYDNKGERTIKYMLSQETQLYQNGALVDGNMALDAYKIYPSPYVVISSDDTYTKHYYIGGQRIASRLLSNGSIFSKSSSVSFAKKSDNDDKEVDPQVDFKNYLNKADININDLETEFLVNHAQPGLFYLHSDHLGTASYVTDEHSETTQFYLNLPYGETMAEQQLMNTYENPYKFNAKELDVETGLYYYGARYYNPRLSVWYSVDPLASMLPTRSPYEYTFSNPVRFTDPTGMYPDGGPGDEPRYGGEIQEVVITKRRGWLYRTYMDIKNWISGKRDLSAEKGGYANSGFFREGDSKVGVGLLQAGYNYQDKRSSTKSSIKLINFESENKSSTSLSEGGLVLDASVKAAVASAQTENSLVLVDGITAFADAEADYAYAKAETSNGIFLNSEKIGWQFGGGAEAGNVKAEVTTGIEVFGLRVGFTEGGCVNCVGASYKIGMYYDNKKGTLNINGLGGAAIEGGIKVGGNVTIPVGKWMRIVSKAKNFERN